MFQREGRSIDALISLLPKPKIWDVEGRVHGTHLGNGRFQFDLRATFAFIQNHMKINDHIKNKF